MQIHLSPVLSGLAILFAKLGVVINPLIYIFNNKDVSLIQKVFAFRFKIKTLVDDYIIVIHHISFKITGPGITQAIMERKATRKKRKATTDIFRDLNSGCDAKERCKSI